MFMPQAGIPETQFLKYEQFDFEGKEIKWFP